MSPVVETILFVFGLVALGYLAGLTGYLKVAVGDALTEFAVGVALPLLLFRTMVGADFHGSAPWALWAAYFSAAAVAWLVGHLAMTRIFGRDPQIGVVGGFSSAYSNLVLLGIPFMLGALGREGFEVLSLLKLFLMPAVALGVALLLGLPPMTAKVAVMAAALPSGVNSYLLAVQFGKGQGLASSQMTIAITCAAVTTAFWLMVVHAVFG